MFESQMLFGSATGTKIYGPWMARQADNAYFTLDVIAISSASLKVEVFHKNSDDTGDGTAAGTVESAATSAQQYSAKVTAMKEMVRYKYTVTDATTKWVQFRMLEPQWFDTVEAST